MAILNRLTSLLGQYRTYKLKLLRYLLRGRLDTKQSVFCNNCVGAMMLHDYNLVFNSPTVNLWISPYEYVKMLSNLRHYMQSDITEIKIEGINYPVGLLDGEITVHFMHYQTFDEAVIAWQRRAKRVNFDNLKAILVDRDGCNETIVKTFLSLTGYRNLIALCRSEMKITDNRVKRIRNCNEGAGVGQLMNVCNRKNERYYDQVCWYKFLIS